jgi:hypothetical protein
MCRRMSGALPGNRHKRKYGFLSPLPQMYLLSILPRFFLLSLCRFCLQRVKQSSLSHPRTHTPTHPPAGSCCPRWPCTRCRCRSRSGIGSRESSACNRTHHVRLQLRILTDVGLQRRLIVAVTAHLGLFTSRPCRVAMGGILGILGLHRILRVTFSRGNVWDNGETASPLLSSAQSRGQWSGSPTLGKSPDRYCRGGGLGGPQSPSGRYKEQSKYLVLFGNRTDTVQQRGLLPLLGQ